MLTLRIKDASVIMRGPEGEEINNLHVLCRQVCGHVLYMSRWEPTPGELEVLNAGGSVELTILGSQPPVKLDVVPHEHG